jgi:hypothetical protein
MVSGRAVSEEAGTLIREDGGIPRIYPWGGCQRIYSCIDYEPRNTARARGNVKQRK